MDTALERLRPALSDRYTLERELGQGGMARVYLAHDRKHDRPVAIKVFRPELSALLGAERFLQEIRVTANLQHPHILQLYDSGSADGLLYYVMPFVAGETLRSRLNREKQLPIAEAVAITRAVASALDYAHRHGVIHRDIKPENILLHDGNPLVADFGIALAVHQAGGDRLTQTGLSLGTPAYMSPEQATGDRALDGRADIYALGAVAYEMLAGDPPHTGSSAQAVIAKIVTEVPARLSAGRPTVPAHIEAAIHTALAKLPADRFATAGAFAEALERGTVVTGAVFPAARPSWMGRAGAIAGVAAVALVAGGLAGRILGGREALPAVPAHLMIAVPGFGFNPIRTMAISEDGQSIVFHVGGPGRPTLRLRRLAAPADEPIPGIEGAVNPALSPDGRRLIYTWQAGASVVPLAGGQPIRLPDVVESSFLTWFGNDSVLYEGNDRSLWIAPADGSRGARRIAVPDTSAGEFVLSPLEVLPGGRHALVLASPITGPTGVIDVLDLRTSRRTRLLPNPVRGAWYAGHSTLVYTTADGTLHGVRFDPAELRVSGEPVVLGGPVSNAARGLSRVSASRTGTVLYAPQPQAELVRIDREGRRQVLLSSRMDYHNPQFSPDGSRISIDLTEPDGRDVWVYSLSDRTLTRVTFENDGHDAIWSRDGRSLAYIASQGGRQRVLTRVPGGNPSVAIDDTVSIGVATPGGWMADGSLIAVGSPNPATTGWDLIRLRPDGTAAPLLVTRFNDAWPEMSPDGRWLAWVSDESRRREVYLKPMTGKDTRIQVSIDGGTEPRWSGRGDELIYLRTGSGVPEMVAARLSLAGEPKVVSREVLFPWTEFEAGEPHANYDVAPDGRSFVGVRRATGSHLVVIQNVQALVHRGGN